MKTLMARQRRSYRRNRPRMNYVWQPMVENTIITVPESTAQGTVVKGVFRTVIPGIGFETEVKAFDSDHVLERIRGAMAHNAIGQESASVTDWLPFSVAAIRVPNGMTAGALNLFDSSEGDDFAFRMDAVCNAGTQQATPNWHEVDSKAKRRFEVGDSLAFLWALVAPGTDTRAFTVEFAMNLRVLWKLS